MKVSFDLDDTLFVSPEKFEVESPPPFPLSRLYAERLRMGTVNLLRSIRARGVEVGIYTTSYRSERYIRNLFRCYGIRLHFIVNGERHAREVQRARSEPLPSKCPCKYRIDLHVDDDPSVAGNGRIYGFRVLLLSGRDAHWTDKILSEIDRLRAKG